MFRAGAKVANVPVEQPDDARLTDAHPAAEWHLDADFLAGVHQRRCPVHADRLLTARELNRAALTMCSGLRHREALQMELPGDTRGRPHPLGVVQHALPPARPGLALTLFRTLTH